MIVNEKFVKTGVVAGVALLALYVARWIGLEVPKWLFEAPGAVWIGGWLVYALNNYMKAWAASLNGNAKREA